MKRKTARRMIGGALIAGGALLMWLSPETWSGMAVMAAGIALEVLGVAFEHG